MDQSPFRLDYKTLLSDADIRREHDKIMNTDLDLSCGNSMNAILIKRSASVHHVIFCYHHVILDGVSWRLYINELNNAYNSQTTVPPDFHHIDFSQKEDDAVNSGQLIRELAFWKDQFSQLPEPLPLLRISKVPCRRAMDIYSTSMVSLYLNIDVATRIRQISKVLHVTPFQFYLSALQVFLYRLMGISDQCIGIIDANRSDLNFASTLGISSIHYH